MKVLKIQSLPIISEAIKWESNEPEIRKFVGEDANLRFLDRGLEVWNRDSQTWQNCPVFYYIVKGQKGEFAVVSPELFDRNYSIVE